MNEPLTITAFIIGITQLVKDTGIITGQTLKAVAIIAGGVAGYMSLYQPEMWASISSLIYALTATGLVSFVDERRKK